MSIDRSTKARVRFRVWRVSIRLIFFLRHFFFIWLWFLLIVVLLSSFTKWKECILSIERNDFVILILIFTIEIIFHDKIINSTNRNTNFSKLKRQS